MIRLPGCIRKYTDLMRGDVAKLLGVPELPRIREGAHATPYGYRLVYRETSPEENRLRRAVIQGRYEAEMGIVRRWIKPGDTVIDVGAYEGFYTLLFAGLVGPTGRVIAFEPSPTNRAYLNLNLRENGYYGEPTGTDLLVLSAAVGAFAGTADYSYDKGEGAWGSVTNPTGRLTRPVDRLSLDSACKRYGIMDCVSFVKVDVEGGEREVILGATQMIEDSRPVIMFEANVCEMCERDDNHKLSELVALVEGLGYNLFRYRGGELVPYTRPRSSVCFNLIAIPQ